MVDATPQEISRFWIEEVGPKGWYEVSEDLDERIRKDFQDAWEAAHAGDLHDWCHDAPGTFGFLILTDQFPRNMFRGQARAFETDALARSAAKMAIDRRWDLCVPEPGRQFFYLPLVHSENLGDQDRAVRLIVERMPETGAENLRHACAHRQVIRRFGRFPGRNKALGRLTLPGEAEYLENNGYAEFLKDCAPASTA
jgi:uncharacterized protein (DUF924 family)